MPFYNEEEKLANCISSIKNQNFSDYELLLIDDGSTDKSLEICNKFIDKKTRIFRKPNEGLVSARNYGLGKSRGSYIIYVDADDMVYNDHFITIACIIKKYPNIDMITFNYDTNMNIDISKPFKNRCGFYNKSQLQNEIYPWIFEIDFNLTAWRSVYKSELVKQHYCKDETIITGEDFAFTYECLYFAKSFYYINKELYWYNDNHLVNKSLSWQHKLDAIGVTRLSLYLFDNLYKLGDNCIKSQLSYFIYNIIFSCFRSVVISHTAYYSTEKESNKKMSLIKISQFWKKNKNVKLNMIAREILKNINLSLWKKIQIILISKKLYWIMLIICKIDYIVYNMLHKKNKTLLR